MGAKQSTTGSPSSPSPSSSSPLSSSSSSSTSPFSLSPTSPPSKLCEFSKKQAEEFNKEIKLLEDSEYQLRIKVEKELQLTGDSASKMFHLASAPFDLKHSYLTKEMHMHPLLIKRLLCLELIDILTKYRDTLIKVAALCEKCQTEEADENVDDKIDEIMKQFEQGLVWFNLFIEIFNKGDFPNDEYGTMLKNKLVKTTSDMNKKFENVENIKSEMKTICQKRNVLRELKSVAYNAKNIGGRSRSKPTSKKQKLSQKQKTKKNKKKSKR